MNTNQRYLVILVLIMSVTMSGCGAGRLFGPTTTPTSTPTSTPTMTPTPTSTPTSTPTMTPTPIPPILTDGTDNWPIAEVTFSKTAPIGAIGEPEVAAGNGLAYLVIRFENPNRIFPSFPDYSEMYVTDSLGEKHIAVTDRVNLMFGDLGLTPGGFTLWFQAMPEERSGFRLYFSNLQPVTLPSSGGVSGAVPSGEVSGAVTIFSTDFNDTSFDGRFDSSQWAYQSDFSDISIIQENGAMVLSKPSASGMQNGTLKTNQTWSLGEFNYIETRLKLDQKHTGEMGNMGFSFGDVSCAVQIQGNNSTPFIWCAQSHTDSNQQWVADYMSDSYFIEYDQWYTTRIEFNSQTNEFKCYIDGKLFCSWQPANIDNLLGNKTSVSLNIWADNGTSMSGYVDDVRIVK